MPDRCAVGGCSNKSSRANGISLHRIPFWNDDRPEARRRRKKWADFVLLRRKMWAPTQMSAICSDHFKPEDFARQFLSVPGQTVSNIPRLIKDVTGIVAVPSVYKDKVDREPPKSARSRTRRMIVKEALQENESNFRLIQPKELFPEEEANTSTSTSVVDTDGSFIDTEPLFKEVPTQTEDSGCTLCQKLTKKNRQLRNQWISSKEKLRKCRARAKTTCTCDCKNTPALPVEQEPYVQPAAELLEEINDFEMESEDDGDVTEEEPDEYLMNTDGDTTETETDEEPDDRVYVTDGNLRTQPKYIVFLSQLLLLFQFCPTCKASNPLVETQQIGTMAVVSTICSNPKCRNDFTWRSQPNIPGTKIAAGNFLLSFAILVSGGSASKIFQMFRHMGLSCISLNTFFEHQRNILFPSIYLHWKDYQKMMFNKLKALGTGLVLAGDGRHDSMGHSAKYCAYTIFSCTLPLIIHFSIVQKNEAGNSPAMEYMAFDRCMTFLFGSGLAITTFISDRHGSIIKHMREKLNNIIHYFDLWHLKKKIHKLLTNISKERDCESLVEWIRPCENHFYWSVRSTPGGNGRVMWAKFKSFLSHIVNKHEDLDDPLFNRCAHPPIITDRTWMQSDSPVYEKVYKALTNPRLVTAIQQASPEDQTSSLEGFHSVLNHFAPKMIAYSFSGMFCRHILAAIHFNSNLLRDVKQKPDGTDQVLVVYPKFKNGEATVRDVRVKPIFDYVEDIYQTTLKALQNKESLTGAMQELKEQTPAAMNTMLEKQSRELAIQKRDERKKMVLSDVPPTNPVSEVLVQEAAQTTKAKPRCSVCKSLMKGHKNISDCPKNNKAGPSTSTN